ncbi:MAG: AAA family ATPase [Planctomycetota bacterium]|jgi:MoxR-like ATPase
MTEQDPDRIEAELEELRDGLTAVRAAIESRVIGQRSVVEGLLWSVLADGHALLEGPPGLGKTTLVKSLADSLELDFRRIQFTPDLMPADVIGMRILDEDENGRRHFVQHRGPIFTNLLLADEINRATPRTQAALLEAMQERQVTLFDETSILQRPFLVIATQNPVEMEGTYPLPEAQLDRFIARIDVEAPDVRRLADILDATSGAAHEPLAQCLDSTTLVRAQERVRAILVSRSILERVAALGHATDPHCDFAPDTVRACVRYGSSPRGGQAVVMLAKARALMAGRLHVSADDVEAVAPLALRHRLILSYEGEARGVRLDDLVGDALAASAEVNTK